MAVRHVKLSGMSLKSYYKPPRSYRLYGIPFCTRALWTFRKGRISLARLYQKGFFSEPKGFTVGETAVTTNAFVRGKTLAHCLLRKRGPASGNIWSVHDGSKTEKDKFCRLLFHTVYMTDGQPIDLTALVYWGLFEFIFSFNDLLCAPII